MTPRNHALAAPARADATRPRFHFGAPYGWMNDPNGTIFHNGFYHLFYQWNPNADTWGSIHWGHARSRDLIHWEHLPAALTPASGLGEEHCFSGCLVVRRDAPPLILYTAIGPQMDPLHGAQQWAAVGDADLVAWQKHPRNPILTQSVHGELEVMDWRDPFVFCDMGRTFMLLGGKLTERDGGAAVALLYEAQDAALEQWNYRGILFSHPDRTRRSVECANLFRSGDTWVLLLATHRLVEYFIGEFDADAGTFTPTAQGMLDGSENFYATNLVQDDAGRQICVGWVRGFAPGRGWNGCLAFPRILSVDDRGNLRQTFAPEINALHEGEGIHAAGFVLQTYAPENLWSDAFDIHIVLRCEPDASVELRLIPRDRVAHAVTFRCAAHEIRLNDQCAALASSTEARRDVHLLLDRTVVQVIVNANAALTLVREPVATPFRIELVAGKGEVVVEQLDVWLPELS